MRDSLQRPPDGRATSADEEESHVCVRDHKAIVRERVGKTLFEFPANSFFQNNNSVLVPLTEYVKGAIFGDGKGKQPTHLVDTYCGSGLFALTLAPSFDRVVGIEISEVSHLLGRKDETAYAITQESIRYATHNIALNSFPPSKLSFLPGTSSKIFEKVQDFPPSSTVVVIDPPRKGCDEEFIEQLLGFGAATVVYVSCNVHTQARDVGRILRGEKGYSLESVRGFDLFPQTAHVESVCGRYQSVSLRKADLLIGCTGCGAPKNEGVGWERRMRARCHLAPVI